MPKVTIGDDKALFRLQNGCAEPVSERTGFIEDQSCLVYGNGELIGIGVFTPEGLKLKIHLGA